MVSLSCNDLSSECVRKVKTLRKQFFNKTTHRYQHTMDIFCHKSEENNYSFPPAGFPDQMEEMHMSIQLSVTPGILLPIWVLAELQANPVLLQKQIKHSGILLILWCACLKKSMSGFWLERVRKIVQLIAHYSNG